MLFLWWTGCRPAELCALKWAFIDTAKAVAVLKDHKTAHSTKEPRIICLPEKAVRLLIWIVRDQDKSQEYVFLNNRGERWTRARLSERFNRFREALNIPKYANLYGCRHAFGTRLAKAGTPLKTISVLMGHTNTNQSEYYIHLAGETVHLHDALEKALAYKKKVEP
jgi:integrase